MKGRVAAGVGLVLLVLFAAFPFYWAVVASFTPEATLFREPSLWPRELLLDHYRALFTERDFWTPIKNSLIVAATTTIFCVTIGAFAAYALARTLYMLLRALRLINTYPGLVLPYVTFAMPLAVWLLVGFFRQLPPDLEEAAMVDGASRWQSFTRVILPLTGPGLATTAILTFIYCWNEFLFALSFTLGPERYTVPVAIALFRGQYQVPWGQVLAATVVATAPVAIVVLAFQRRIVQGLTAGAVKG